MFSRRRPYHLNFRGWTLIHHSRELFFTAMRPPIGLLYTTLTEQRGWIWWSKAYGWQHDYKNTADELPDGIHKKKTHECLLKLLAYGCQCSAVFPNFWGPLNHYPPIRKSAKSGCVPTIPAHLPLLNHMSHNRFWVALRGILHVTDANAYSEKNVTVESVSFIKTAVIGVSIGVQIFFDSVLLKRCYQV